MFKARAVLASVALAFAASRARGAVVERTPSVISAARFPINAGTLSAINEVLSEVPSVAVGRPVEAVVEDYFAVSVQPSVKGTAAWLLVDSLSEKSASASPLAARVRSSGLPDAERTAERIDQFAGQYAGARARRMMTLLSQGFGRTVETDDSAGPVETSHPSGLRLIAPPYRIGQREKLALFDAVANEAPGEAAAVASKLFVDPEAIADGSVQFVMRRLHDMQRSGKVSAASFTAAVLRGLQQNGDSMWMREALALISEMGRAIPDYFRPPFDQTLQRLTQIGLNPGHRELTLDSSARAAMTRLGVVPEVPEFVAKESGSSAEVVSGTRIPLNAYLRQTVATTWVASLIAFPAILISPSLTTLGVLVAFRLGVFVFSEYIWKLRRDLAAESNAAAAELEKKTGLPVDADSAEAYTVAVSRFVPNMSIKLSGGAALALALTSIPIFFVAASLPAGATIYVAGLQALLDPIFLAYMYDKLRNPVGTASTERSEE